METLHVVANPQSGKGAGGRTLEKLRTRLWSGTELRILETGEAGQAGRYARELANHGVDRIIVLGGDGTVSEVVAGIGGLPVALGIIAEGTGNDLARSLCLPVRDLESSLEVIRSGRVRKIDLALCNDRRFISSLALGFPAQVGLEVSRQKLIRGRAAFLVSSYRILRDLRTWPMKLCSHELDLQVDCVAILIQNTPFVGGGLRVAPDARLDDGLLDVVVVRDIRKWDVVLNFPRLYRGSHVDLPAVSVFRTADITVSSPADVPGLCDGEPMSSGMPFLVRVEPATLRVIVAG